MAVMRVAVCWLALPGVAGHGTLLESLQSDDFAPYVGYGGPLAVTGRVGPLTSDLWTQTFAYALDGVDPRCAGGLTTHTSEGVRSTLRPRPNRTLKPSIARPGLALPMCLGVKIIT